MSVFCTCQFQTCSRASSGDLVTSSGRGLLADEPRALDADSVAFVVAIKVVTLQASATIVATGLSLRFGFIQSCHFQIIVNRNAKANDTRILSPPRNKVLLRSEEHTSEL